MVNLKMLFLSVGLVSPSPLLLSPIRKEKEERKWRIKIEWVGIHLVTPNHNNEGKTKEHHVSQIEPRKKIIALHYS
jgi:hypothetical protein